MSVYNLKRLCMAGIDIITDQLLLTSADFLFSKDYELSFFEKTLKDSFIY